MPLSKERAKGWYEDLKDWYTREEITFLIELFNYKKDNKELTEDMLNRLLQLEVNELDVIVEHLGKKNLIQFLKVYREKKKISLQEYYKLMRFYIWNEYDYEELYNTSSFRKKYKYPISLFYYLNKDLGLSYRDLEVLSGVGKDTLNSYVNRYCKWRELRSEILSLEAQIRDLKQKRLHISQKF